MTMADASTTRPFVRSIEIPLLLIAGILALSQTFSKVAPILLSFLLTILVTLALNPIIRRLRAWTGGRKRATGLVAATVILLAALAGWAFLGPMMNSATRLVEQFPGYWERLQRPLIRMQKQAVLSESRLEAEVATEIGLSAVPPETPSTGSAFTGPTATAAPSDNASIQAGLSQLLQRIAASLTGVAFDAAQVMVVLTTVFFGVTFTLMNPRPIFGAFFSLIPEPHHRQTLVIARRIGNFVPQWAGATLVGMFTIGLLVFLVMWPIFGLADALVLGLIAGLFEAIPFVGPLLSAVPALLLAVGEGGLTPVWVIAGYLSVQALENNIILPLIMARGLRLHPLAVIFSMLLCVSAFGVLGVLVAAPLVAVSDILHDELYRKHFLPSVTPAGLDRLSRQALHETGAEVD